MNNSSHKNLQELCRACLGTIQNTRESADITDGDSDEACNINSLLLPNLSKLFMLLTTYDVNKELGDFPKRLCERCYSLLLDYDEFHKLVVKSTEILYEKLNANKEEEPEIGETKETEQFMQLVDIKYEKNFEENDDDKLLLPELVRIPLYIKPETVGRDVDTQFTLPANSKEGEINSQEYLLHDTEENVDKDGLDLPNGSGNNSSTSIHSFNGNVVFSKKYRGRNTLYCNACNKQFYKQIYLDAHIRVTHLGQEKPFQCSNCTKAFTRYRQLAVHMKSKHIDMFFRCDYKNCDATYDAAKKLKIHRQFAHSSDKRRTTTRTSDKGKDKSENMQLQTDLICYLCDRKYSSKHALKEHIKRHKKIKEHSCPECGVAKVTRTELLTHMRTHTPNVEKFACPQCPQVFNHKNAISRHVKVIHEGLRSFKCTYCTRRFGTRNSQVCHERLHTGERPFTCEICKRGFAQVEGLRSHMKNHNKNLRKHVCKYCSQRFITLKNLIDHERRHLGDKPNICDICNKGFHIAEDLKNHRRIHLKHAAGQDQQRIVDNVNQNKRAKKF